MEENNEKSLLFFKTIVVGIAYSIIGICSLFFILVSKVNAASSIKGYNTNGADLQECYNCTELTSSRTYIDFNYDYNYQESTNLNIQFNNIIVIQQTNGTLNIPAPTILVVNGYQTYNIGSYCTNVVSTKTTEPGAFYDTITINYAYTCDIPNYGENFPNYNSLKITYEKSYTGLITSQKNYDNGFQVIETAYNPEPTETDYTGTINSVGGNIINNNKQNTESIINNNNQNAQDIIDNQNANSQAQIEAIEKQNLKCEDYDFTNEPIEISGYYLNNTGTQIQNSGYSISKYIPINKDKNYNIQTQGQFYSVNYCIYGEDKTLIQCATQTNNSTITINESFNGFVRYTIRNSATIKFTGEYCYNLLEKQNETQKEQFDYMKDTNIDSSSMSGFDVAFDYGGITNVITAPLQAINSLLNNTCSNLVIPIPFVNNKNLTLPCLTPIYQQHFNGVLVLYQTIITGIVAYWICLNIFHMVHGFSDPTEDKIEVVDL